MKGIREYAMLERYGFRLLPYGIAKDEAGVIERAEEMGYPVALKIIAPGITHKTEVGGVKVGMRNHAALKVAMREMRESARAHGVKPEGFLVQKMARKGMELIIGGKKDAQFGHLIILGFGGIYVEVFKDVTARLCPIGESDVEEMIDELKSHPLIRGARGQRGVNIRALKDVMLRTCRMLVKEGMKELDLNPVIFDDKGCDIVDVRFTR